MYSIYKRGGYPQPPILPVGNKYCPPIPGIVPLSESIQSNFYEFVSTIRPPFPNPSFLSTIVTSTIIYTSSPIDFVALVNSYKSLAESGRMLAEQCPTMYISNAPVPVQTGDSNNVPYINVIPASASGTTQSIQNAVLFAGNNPYNPATRFSQYRFANTVIPPPPPCPVAVPNPGYVAPCVPPLMFRGSVENVGPT